MCPGLAANGLGQLRESLQERGRRREPDGSQVQSGRHLKVGGGAASEGMLAASRRNQTKRLDL